MTMYQTIDSRLQEITESCVKHACLTFNERKEKDTNPFIVQMIVRDEPIQHWYYRSDEWIEQPYAFPDRYVDAYCGPPIEDIRAEILYSIKEFTIDEDITSIAKSNTSLFNF